MKNRPYILYSKVVNKGEKPREGRADKKGIKRGKLTGEMTLEVQKFLVDKNGSLFVWATPENIGRRLDGDQKPIGWGNFDNLDRDYPAQKEKLLRVLDVVRPAIEANARVAELEKKLAEIEKNGTKAKSGKSKKISSGERGSSEEAPGAAGAAH